MTGGPRALVEELDLGAEGGGEDRHPLLGLHVGHEVVPNVYGFPPLEEGELGVELRLPVQEQRTPGDAPGRTRGEDGRRGDHPQRPPDVFQRPEGLPAGDDFLVPGLAGDGNAASLNESAKLDGDW
jgi:hypothetical protein